MDSVVFFEIPAKDERHAQEFYKSAFGWSFQGSPQSDYTFIVTGPSGGADAMPTKPGIINGGFLEKEIRIKTPVVTIGVSDMDSTLKRVVQNGGKVVVPKTPVGEMGFSAYFADTDGNVLGLFQEKSK